MCSQHKAFVNVFTSKPTLPFKNRDRSCTWCGFVGTQKRCKCTLWVGTENFRYCESWHHENCLLTCRYGLRLQTRHCRGAMYSVCFSEGGSGTWHCAPSPRCLWQLFWESLPGHSTACYCSPQEHPQCSQVALTSNLSATECHPTAGDFVPPLSCSALRKGAQIPTPCLTSKLL